MAIKKRTLKLQFGQKHKDYIRRCLDNTFNIAEGAVRAGKTVDNIYAFRKELETSPDKIHLASASTLGTAKLNLGECNGLGLEYLFKGRCRWGKFKDNEALFVYRCPEGPKTKIIIFAGGGKADSFKKIRGNSYGMWIATEINLHHDSFIKEAHNRLLAAGRRKLFWDLNPDNPNAPIYQDYIDKYRAKQAEGTLLGGCNYEHFTILDNITITEARKQEIISEYDPTSVWYRRDILGQRCPADGLVYQQFADQPERWLLHFDSKQAAKDWFADVQFISIGIDFGGNRSLTTFAATAVHRGYQKLTVIGDYHIKGRKGEIDSDRVNQEFLAFYQRIKQQYPHCYIKYCFADSEAQYLINGLRKACRNAGIALAIGDSAKHEIVQRIICTNTLLNTGRVFFMPACSLVIGGLQSAVWDSKEAEKGKDVRLDNFSTDIDILDAFEYSWERFIPKLIPNGR